MKETGRSQVQAQRDQHRDVCGSTECARAALWDPVVLSGVPFVEEQLEWERTALCGPRDAHQTPRPAAPPRRWC